MQVVIATLLIYSLISTIIIELSGENDTVIAIFAFGPIGLLLIAIAKVYSRIRQYFKYDFKRKSIFEDKDGNNYICSIKKGRAVSLFPEYKRVFLRAAEDKWKGLPVLPKEYVAKCWKQRKRTCRYCKYDGFCDEDTGTTKCKCDENGYIIDYDAFEKRK